MSSNLVIVAIPREDDPVWKISSEKVPHLTLLFLGEAEGQPVEQIASFLEHAIRFGSLTRFGLDVDRRGELGDDKADVLFFQDNWELPRVRDFRSLLLKDHNIKTGFDSAEQHPGWTPHLTLGYPETPAKKMPEHMDRLYWVQFDKIAVWTGDYEGPEFLLKNYRDEYPDDYYPTEVAMSDTAAAGRQFLAHFGVKGMRWGVRKSEATKEVSVKQVSAPVTGKTKVKATGGENHPAHEDAIKAAAQKQKLRKSGVAALSNQELRDLATRAQLEAQVTQVARSAGRKFVQKQLSGAGTQQTQLFINEQAAKQRRKVA